MSRSIIRSCETRRSFKVEEVDSAERSRTMVTKNKPSDLALRSHGLPLNSTHRGVRRQSWKGTKEEQRTARGSGGLGPRAIAGESGVALAVGREPGWRGGGMERMTADNARFRKRKPVRVEVNAQVERSLGRRQTPLVKNRKKAKGIQRRASRTG